MVGSVPAVFAVPHALSLNLDAVHMQWIQCATRWRQSVITDDAVPMKVDAVMLQGLQCAHSATSAGCSVSAVVAVPPALSLNVDALPMQWLQCHRMWMQ